ncbi:MAG: bifunctional DNA-formamidopyrimidine glycosylase/DNA-(apurinic or apyrimidinic site) lyase [Gemmatimonadetes bacterium]|nr:bifunctional DNA-formamidopyrimidine glycosylase/DNA-(apurinic or apyrimidinic site) lyase [Gemmatimonadota bacterium]
MPELPEAETIVRGLRPAAVGRRIDEVEVVHADVLIAPAARLRKTAAGRRITGVARRAKNVLLELDDGSVIWINLGMTGAVLPLPRPRGAANARTRYADAATHPTVIFRLDRGLDLVFDDSRRFGTVQHLDQAASAARSATFGPEPLGDDFTPDGLWRTLKASRSPIRSWLLDQRRLAGVGNIYASEALFLAGIHPARRTNTVRRDEAAALHRAIREVLAASIRAGGTTIRDYRNAEGGAGEYGRQLRVYDREGSPCTWCSRPIRRLVLSNRSTFFCPACQPRRAAPRKSPTAP